MPTVISSNRASCGRSTSSRSSAIASSRFGAAAKGSTSSGSTASGGAAPAARSSRRSFPAVISIAERARTATWDDILPGSWDPHERIKVLDEEGIDVAFLYPSFYLVYGDLDGSARSPSRPAAPTTTGWRTSARPYPKRLYGVAPMPIQDVDAAVIEMRRVVKELNFKAVFIRPNPFNHRRLNDPAYDLFWREAQELDIPVAVHSSFGTKMPTLGADRYLHDIFSFHMVCHPFEQQAACMDVICGGVLERFPKLRVGFLECGCGMGRLLARSHGWPLREDGIDGAVAAKSARPSISWSSATCRSTPTNAR